MGFYSQQFDTEHIVFKSRILWHGGNILMWFIVDILFGLGRKGCLFSEKC